MDFDILKPNLKDIDNMRKLVSEYVKSGIILDRSAQEMSTAIRSYYIATPKGDRENIIGFCALHIYSPTLAEVRSLIVKEEFRGFKVGSTLVKTLLQEGSELGISEVLVLTYKVELFKKLGFELIDKSLLPNHKIWADCIKCKHFPVCDEVALIKKL